MLAQKEEEVLTFVEEEAQYPGGMGEMIRFLQENLKYPEDAWKAGIQGKAVIRFIVEKDGSIQTVHVARGCRTVLNAMKKRCGLLNQCQNGFRGKLTVSR